MPDTNETSRIKQFLEIIRSKQFPAMVRNIIIIAAIIGSVVVFEWIKYNFWR